LPTRSKAQGLVTRTDKSKIPDADGDFSQSPYFKFNDGGVRFSTSWVGGATDNYGSASGLASKSFHDKKEYPQNGYSFYFID
jgi:hypothetical protein